jgi:hypothetical protein
MAFEMIAGAVAPISDPTFWFACMVGGLMVSTAAFFFNRLAFGDRISWFQKYTYVPFLLIAVGSLLVLVGFAVARGLG